MHESFLSQNIFSDSKKIFYDFSVRMQLQNKKIESVNENKNKENKNFDEFQECTFQQKPANTHENTKRHEGHEGMECHIVNPSLT